MVSGYVFGAMLEPAADIERVELALVVAEQPDVVPWMARPPRLEALAEVASVPEVAAVVVVASCGLAGLEPHHQSCRALLER